MIAGIGTDIVDIAQFAEQLADPASSFVEGTFTLQEQRDAAHRPSHQPTQHLAARFAAKEAFLKASLSAQHPSVTRLSHVDMREIEIVTDREGCPFFRLHGKIADAFGVPCLFHFHLSMSHDGRYATAFVILERR